MSIKRSHSLFQVPDANETRKNVHSCEVLLHTSKFVSNIEEARKEVNSFYL